MAVAKPRKSRKARKIAAKTPAGTKKPGAAAKRKVAARTRKPETGAAKADAKLAAYRAKRDFTVTKEPASGKPSVTGRRLVVQHHFARREHFDLRLEADGVLKSWAVTRGPSANPRDKRLAVRTEDHPLDYAEFEGTIPANEYGGGTVILWESAEYIPLNGDPAAAIEAGEIKFRSTGTRMKGAWVLVRMKTAEKRENWLLIKERDGEAEDNDTLSTRFPTSIVSNRTRAQIEQGKPGRVARKPAKPRSKAESAGRAPVEIPAFIPPMLCTLAETVPEGAWLHELKYDGYRVQLAIAGGRSKILTRSGLDWTAKFPAVARAAAALPCRSALIDGEAVMFDARGISDFPALVQALENSRTEAIAAVAFDLLHLDGRDLRPLPVQERKARLQALLAGADAALSYAAHVADKGQRFFDAAVAGGAEGIISKRADSTYFSGRSRDWQKIKSDRRDDVVVVGFMPSQKGELFASLLAAREEAGGLRYIGRIGTGYDARRRAHIRPRLGSGRKAPSVPLGDAEKLPRGALFVDQPFRAEVRFGGWTGDRQMRHARFLVDREDWDRPAPRKAAIERAPMAKPFAITHRERVLFPADGVTKGDISDYFARAAARLLPHLHERPLSMLRVPENIDTETFFQRHPLKGMKRGLTVFRHGASDYFTLDGIEGLTSAAQFGAVELHGWMMRTGKPGFADRMVFDLDPDEGMDFPAIRKAAADIRTHLADIGIRTWPMVTGGKGVHIIAPLDQSLTSDQVAQFSKSFAAGLAGQEPARFTATMSKAKRKGKIFIDWLRNRDTATAIIPWSPRARAGATVAVPVSWEALTRIRSAAAFSLRTALRQPDPMADFFTHRQTIDKSLLRFMGIR